MSQGDAPLGWTTTTMGDALTWSSGGTPSRSRADYFGGEIPWLASGELRDSLIYRTNETITESGLASSSAKWVPPDSVLVAMYGATIGRLGISRIPLTTNQAVAFSTPSYLEAKYLFYFLMFSRPALVSLGKGGAQPNISQGVLKAFEFTIAPLPEQRRIVAALDSYFSRLDDASATLERVQRNLERYRASVLKAAVEGRLVPTEAQLARKEGRSYEPASELLKRILVERRRKWEEAELAKMIAKGKPPKDDRWKVKYVEPTPPETEGLPELPEGWCWASVDAVGDVLLGRQRAPQYLTGRFTQPYLRVANIKDDRIDFSDVETMDFDDEHFAKYRLRSGDILVSEGQSPELLGQSAIYRGEQESLCFQKTLHRFRPFDCGPSSEFAQLVFRSHVRNGVFMRLGSITTNIAHLTLEKFKASPFPLAPISEQRRIETETARLLSIADALETLGKSDSVRVTRLRQSILKWAFEGRLVDQDPSDEPASVLLDRIRSERLRENSRSKSSLRTQRRST